MASVSYSDLFSYFLGDVTDGTFVSLNSSDANELMTEYLHKTIAEPYISRLFSSLSLDDEIQILTYTMDYTSDDSVDLDFIKLILSKGMVIKWLQPQVKSRANIAQAFTNKEANFFSQSAHTSTIESMYNDAVLELRNLIKDRNTTNNSYFGES